MAGGRPEIYTSDIANAICTEIATSSRSLRTICKQDKMPSVSTILIWLRDKPEFLTQYTRAKEEQADFLVEEMLDISDDKTNDVISTETGESGNSVAVSRARLQVDTRKWLSSKLKPKKYGEKLDLGGSVEQIIRVKVQGEDDND